MKKNEVIKFLKKMQSTFTNEEKAIDAINILMRYAEELPQDSKKASNNDISIIPIELKNLSEGFAVFSDGACRGNPGPGAYGIIVLNATGEVLLKSTGIDTNTTNNKMEILGVIKGLEGLFDKFLEDGFSSSELPVFVYSDSKYVIDGINSWVQGWKERGWKKADGKVPENLNLWMELDRLKNNFSNINFVWIKGHAGHPQNELCDEMANIALDEAGF
jgi:ribonuclease HI